MGDEADWLIDQMLMHHPQAWCSPWEYESPATQRRKWYRKRYAQERRMRKLTLEQVQKRSKR